MAPCRRSRHAPDQRQIGALQRPGPAVIGELFSEAPVGAVVLGHDEETAGVLVEPMHDAWPLDAADAGEAVPAMGDQRVHQRARFVAGGRMDDEPGGLSMTIRSSSS